MYGSPRSVRAVFKAALVLEFPTRKNSSLVESAFTDNPSDSKTPQPKPSLFKREYHTDGCFYQSPGLLQGTPNILTSRSTRSLPPSYQAH